MDFQVADSRQQAQLHATVFNEWIYPDGTRWTAFYRTETGYLLRFPELADFEVSRDGRKIRCWPAPEVSEGTVQHLYLNQVLPLALSKCGKLVFHASAVEINGGGIVFMGESGRGKSTLAASFTTSGFRFLSDDGLEIERHSGGYRILPSHPSIRLWADSEKALIGEGVQLGPPVQFTSKARFLAGEGIVFCEQSRRLQRVYFLGEEAPNPVFQRLRPIDALIELVKNSFLLDIEERELLAAHFDELARLVSHRLYYRLNYPRRFEDLARIRQAIVEHANEKGAM